LVIIMFVTVTKKMEVNVTGDGMWTGSNLVNMIRSDWELVTVVTIETGDMWLTLGIVVGQCAQCS
jgi:hypothetical protein